MKLTELKTGSEVFVDSSISTNDKAFEKVDEIDVCTPEDIRLSMRVPTLKTRKSVTDLKY